MIYHAHLTPSKTFEAKKIMKSGKERHSFPLKKHPLLFQVSWIFLGMGPFWIKLDLDMASKSNIQIAIKIARLWRNGCDHRVRSQGGVVEGIQSEHPYSFKF